MNTSVLKEPTKQGTSVMSPYHYYWKEFMRALDSLLNERDVYCDFIDHDDYLGGFRCGGSEMTITRKVLSAIRCVDVDMSIEYLRKNGACCDCDIMTNYPLKHEDPTPGAPLG